MAHLWTRRSGESIAAYAAFQLYLQHGSIDAAWRATNQGQTSNAKRAPGQWPIWSSKHEWVSRAGSYSDYLVERDRLDFEEERRQDKADRIRILRAYRGRLTQGLATLDPATVEWKDITAGLKMVIDELRSEYDEQPKQRIEISGAALDGLIEHTARRLAGLAHGGQAQVTGPLASDDADSAAA